MARLKGRWRRKAVKGEVPFRPPWTRSGLLSMGETVVRTALGKGAEEAEAYLGWAVGTSVDIEGGRISYPMRGSTCGISVRVLRDGRVGFAFCTEEKDIPGAVERALDISRLGKRVGFHFPQKASHPRARGVFDPRIPYLAAGDGMALSARMLREAHCVHRGIRVTGGGVDFGWSLSGCVNSAGVAAAERGTQISAAINVSLKERTTSTGFESQSSRSLELDVGKLARTAAELALRGRSPVRYAPGPRTVILAPDAAASLLGDITLPALIGESALRGESVYSGRLGGTVASPGICFIDDGLLPGGLGTSASDDEGAPSRENVLVEKGVLRGFLFDSYSAAEFGCATTGSAIRGSHRTPPSASHRNFVVLGPERELDELVSETGEGLLVHEVLGAHTANPASGDFSVSAPLLFRISKGGIGPPLKPVMLSGNLPDLLRAVTGAGKDRRSMTTGSGPVVTGSLRMEGLMVTS